MEQNLSRRRETGSWAPVVGVALAALTIGSLITFSVIAQRTSLDGFSARGVTARPPAQESAVSITLDPAAPRPDDAGSGAGAGADEGAVAVAVEPDASALIFTSDLEPAGASEPLSVTSVAALQEADGSEASTGTETTLVAAGDLEPDSLLTFKAASGGGYDYEARGASDWKHGKKDARNAKPDKAKAKKANAKAKKATAKKAKKAKKPKRARRDAGRRPGRPGSDASASSSASRRSPSARRAAPSRPAPASSSRAHKPSPPGHSKQKGKGHSKGRGRGHRYD